VTLQPNSIHFGGSFIDDYLQWARREGVPEEIVTQALRSRPGSIITGDRYQIARVIEDAVQMYKVYRDALKNAEPLCESIPLLAGGRRIRR